jgi:hypothetical protein
MSIIVSSCPATFREHSGNTGTFREQGNVQGTFRENVGNTPVHRDEHYCPYNANIQGTIRERSVRVEVDACELPSQLQEGLKESTKVDTEINLRT